MTRLSVVILNHDYARYLPAAIDSAARQDHGDVEIIVVDDASTDESREVIADHHDVVRPVLHDRNLGQGAGVNSGFAAASGDVVWFLDADDVLFDGAASAAVSAVEAGAAKFHGPLALIDGDGQRLGPTVPAAPERLAEGDLVTHVGRFRSHGWPPMSGNAFAADALRELLPVPADAYRQAADSFLCEQAAICGPVARSMVPVGGYRLHGSNQFAGKPVSLEWLRTKLGREVCSHRHLVRLADRLGVGPIDAVPSAARDVALLGYRLASLRLDPDGHPSVAEACGGDTRWRLGVDGIRAAITSPQLATLDRLVRSVWFATVAALPPAAARYAIAGYLPDGPRPPFWKRIRPRGGR